MGVKDLITVGGLALLDSLNITLFLVTLHLLLAHRRPLSRVLVLLGVFFAVYAAVGIAVVAGAGVVLGAIGERGVDHVQLVAGIALLLYGVLAEVDRPPRDDEASAGRGHLGVAGLALVVAAVEVSTALPYLAALATIGRADLPLVAGSALVAVYCLVVVAPCLVVALVHRARRERVRERFSGLVTRLRSGDGGRRGLLLLCIVAGFYVAGDALARLEFFGLVDLTDEQLRQIRGG
ncbi:MULTISPECIES: GAP family protein [Actinosynnema]|uniref:GAP family protein n=1 Tax=Actinosynnema TaxID=40566 RepID=UPI0020A3AA6A|nr:GAP family protein [Actinosynnema pretiosum]MCP2096531.1 Sap, sulfolipid-1-addressing protein [Actinosynnema pretiosum]